METKIVAALKSVSSWRMEKLPKGSVEAFEFTGEGGGWHFLIVRWPGGVDGTARRGGLVVHLSSPLLRKTSTDVTQTGYVNRSGVV